MMQRSNRAATQPTMSPDMRALLTLGLPLTAALVLVLVLITVRTGAGYGFV